MRKFSDLEDGEKRNLEDQLEAISQTLGMSSYDSYGNKPTNSLNDFIGLCANCQSLSYCKTEFGTVHAKCEAFKMKINGQNRITECNLHSPKGVMSLNEMEAIAYLIDTSPTKTHGFISKERKLMGKPNNKRK